MRELHYAILKNSNYKTMILTAAAEALTSQKAQFLNNVFIVKDTGNLNARERQILTKIRLNEPSRFHFSDYRAWTKALLQECFTKGYLRYFLFLWIQPTGHFKRAIRQHKQSFNQNIIDYIDTGDISHLQKINTHFEKIKLPEYTIPRGSRDTDIEMLKDYLRKKHGGGTQSSEYLR